MSNEKLPILREWNDDLVLPPSFDEYQDKLQQEKAHSSEHSLPKNKSVAGSLSKENND